MIGGRFDRALRRYRRRHASELGAHQAIIESQSRVRPFDRLERLMFRAGVEDQTVARALDRFGGRLICAGGAADAGHPGAHVVGQPAAARDRKACGVVPVQRLNARWNTAGSA